MAVEIFVLSDRQAGSMAEWQEAVEAEGFDLRLSTDRPFSELSGPLPAQLFGEDVRFACDHFVAATLMAHNAQVDFGHSWKFALAIRVGADLNPFLGAWIAAATYAKAVDGVVFDETEARVYTPEEALRFASCLLREIPRLQAELTKPRERTGDASKSSPTVISIRVSKGEQQADEAEE